MIFFGLGLKVYLYVLDYMPLKKKVGKGGAVSGVSEDVTDIIDKKDFEGSSEEEEGDVAVERDVSSEKEKEEDDDTLKNADYGDDEAKEAEIFEEGEEAYEDDTCVYKFAKKSMSESDEEEEEVVFEDDIEVGKNTDQIVAAEERETKPILTKYERVRILGDRAKQLSLGAKPMLLNVDNMNPKEIAKLELERKVIPFIIEKTLPDGRRERWKLNELAIVN